MDEVHQQPKLHYGGRHRLQRPADDDMSRRRVGDPQPTGRLQRPTERFRLASGLTAPGDIPLADALALIVADWNRQAAAGNVSADAIDFYTCKSTALVSYASAKGCITLADVKQPVLLMWMRAARQPGAASTINTQYSRRSAVRAFFTTAICLGLHDQNPAQSIELPQRDERYVCAFTAPEIAQLQQTAAFRIGETKVPATLALTLQGATCLDAGYVAVRDVDLVNRLVWLGTRPSPRSRSRWAVIEDDWSLRALTERVNALAAITPADDLAQRPLIYDRRSASDTPSKRSSATTTALTNLMKTARLYEPGVNRVESIREYVAARTYARTGSVEAVAARLGMSSLDAAAHILGLDWFTAHTPNVTPPAWAHAPAGSDAGQDADQS